MAQDFDKHIGTEMPLYEYHCDACGHSCELLESINAPQVQKCSACGKESLRRQVSATNFQLKGSGWYVTDFRDPKKPKDNTGGGSDSTKKDDK